MSTIVDRDLFWRHNGKKVEIYRLKRGLSRVRTDGVLSSGADELVYPDESITSGLRIEYTAFINPFVSSDPESTKDSANSAVTTPVEETHVNLNRMLALSVVSYIRAMLAEEEGDVQRKEYYMRDFLKKVSDNESNKRNVSMSAPITPYAVR